MLTWPLIRQGARVDYEPSAVAVTPPDQAGPPGPPAGPLGAGHDRGIRLILYRFQRRRVFNLLGLRVRRNALGFVGFVLAYQMVMSPVAVVGCGQELLGLRRRWK